MWDCRDWYELGVLLSGYSKCNERRGPGEKVSPVVASSTSKLLLVALVWGGSSFLDCMAPNPEPGSKVAIVPCDRVASC